MKIGKLIFIIGFIFLLLGCSSFRSNDPFGRYFPKNPNWQLADTKTVDLEGKICFESVYVNEQPEQSQKRYMVYRFFEGGQVMSLTTNNYSNAEAVNSFERVLLGYFKVEKDFIFVEIFTPMNFGQYWYYKGVLNDEGFSLISHGRSMRIQDNKFEEPRFFRKVPLEGLKHLEPDW